MRRDQPAFCFVYGRTLKRFGFAQKCDRFSALVSSTTEEKVPDLNKRYFGKFSSRYFPKTLRSALVTFSVVEDSSAEKRSHPCPKPKRFRGSRITAAVGLWCRGACLCERRRSYKQRAGGPKVSGAMWRRWCWRCWLLPLTLTRALGNADKGFLAILVTISPPSMCLWCWYGSFGGTRYGETAT